jgi:hypothetical protein
MAGIVNARTATVQSLKESDKQTLLATNRSLRFRRDGRTKSAGKNLLIPKLTSSGRLIMRLSEVNSPVVPSFRTDPTKKVSAHFQ